MKGRIAARFKTRTRQDWEARFAGRDACVTPVVSMAEAPDHPHNLARSTFIEFAGVTQPGPSPRFDRTPAEISGPPPVAGQHSDDVLVGFGFDETERESLRRTGAVR